MPVEFTATLLDDQLEYARGAMRGVYPATDGPSGPPGPEVFVGTEGLPAAWKRSLAGAALALQECYAKAAVDEPRLKAAVDVTCAVTPEGVVIRVDFSELSEPLGECLRSVLGSTRLAPLTEPAPVKLTLPVMFVGADADLAL